MRFINTPDLTNALYAQVADYPFDPPIAVCGDKKVYKGRRKVYLVKDDVVVDFYEWDIYGSQYRDVQRAAMAAWGISWSI